MAEKFWKLPKLYCQGHKELTMLRKMDTVKEWTELYTQPVACSWFKETDFHSSTKQFATYISIDNINSSYCQKNLFKLFGNNLLKVLDHKLIIFMIKKILWELGPTSKLHPHIRLQKLTSSHYMCMYERQDVSSAIRWTITPNTHTK